MIRAASICAYVLLNLVPDPARSAADSAGYCYLTSGGAAVVRGPSYDEAHEVVYVPHSRASTFMAKLFEPPPPSAVDSFDGLLASGECRRPPESTRPRCVVGEASRGPRLLTYAVTIEDGSVRRVMFQARNFRGNRGYAQVEAYARELSRLGQCRYDERANR